MGENVVSSFNLFIDTDRGSPGSNSTGDDYQLNLNSVNLDADKGQIIRMTVNNFSMYKCFTNVNAHNSRFTLRTNQGTTSLNLPHKNHDTIHKLAGDFGDTLKAQLLVDAQAVTGSSATQVVMSIISPLLGVGVAGTSNNVISVKVEFLDTGGNPVAHNLNSALVQFYERDPKYNTDSDIYSLLGGNRIRDKNDTTTNSITTTIETNSITFTGLYPAQRHTEQYVYLRTSLNGNTLATTSLEGAHSSESVSNVHHSNILGRFVIDTEMVQYAAGTGREYFIDLPTQRHVQNIRFWLTDHHGRKLSQFAPKQNTLGNMNFSLVLRVDIIQKRAPNERFTEEVQRPIPARFSNPTIQYDGHTR